MSPISFCFSAVERNFRARRLFFFDTTTYQQITTAAIALYHCTIALKLWNEPHNNFYYVVLLKKTTSITYFERINIIVHDRQLLYDNESRVLIVWSF